jgi:hypothetical protein
MIDTPKDSPARLPSKGGDPRRDKGRVAPPRPPSATDAPPGTTASSPAEPVAPDLAIPEPAAAKSAAPELTTPERTAPEPAAAEPAAGPAPEPLGTTSAAPMSRHTAAEAVPHRRAALGLPVAAGAGAGLLAGLIVAWLAIGSQPDQPSIDPARIDALDNRLRQAETQGAAQGPALQGTAQRLGALEAALRDREAAANQSLEALRAGLEQQKSALAAQQGQADQRFAEAQNALAQRIAGAEAQLTQRVAAAEAALAPKLAALDESQQQRLGALESRVTQQLSAAEQAANQAAATREQQMNARFAALEQREARITAAEQRLNRLVASTALTSALEAGQPLGAALAGLPGTPAPALEAYRTAAPPTAASLRLSFDDAARAARAASQPATEGQGVLEAAATRLSNLVTVRRGDQTVWGDAVGGELEGARQALDAGDIAAAVQKVEALPEKTRAPMAGWLSQARGLLAARAALGELVSPKGQG